ncbi:MAG: hypothetical protein ACKVOH_06390 [Chlamydiales bacterium]
MICLASNGKIRYEPPMLRIILPLVLLLALLSLSPQKNTLDEMKRDLTVAEKELAKAHNRVLHLRETIATKEIERIEQDIKKEYKDRLEELDFLDLQRKNLSSIMNEVPSCITDAQVVLDQILTKITDLKEENELAPSLAK